MIKSKMKIELSCDPEYVSIIRLTTSGIANKIGFNIDDIEDLKVAVSEACTNAIKHSTDKEFSIEFRELENAIEIEVSDKGIGYEKELIPQPEIHEMKESGLGLFIIESLMDVVEVKDQGRKIVMRKYLGDDR